MTKDLRSRMAHFSNERRVKAMALNEEHQANRQLEKAQNLMSGWLIDEIDDSNFWESFKLHLQRFKELSRNARRLRAKAETHIRNQQVTPEF